ncbi:hypothetical protein [Aeromicrobium endophyticum]|uniref:hypothetical protein n=1 Tax=Aeromicrobium endophyticum TaxID=2292704 RepID=UPI001313DAB8|nr:hypothetical protein [Aeromicrobium endophyticum]
MRPAPASPTTRAAAPFVALFALIYAIALLPPVYVGLTRQHGLIAAVPVSVWYLLIVSAAAIAATTGLWVAERRRGELDR